MFHFSITNILGGDNAQKIITYLLTNIKRLVKYIIKNKNIPRNSQKYQSSVTHAQSQRRHDTSKKTNKKTLISYRVEILTKTFILINVISRKFLYSKFY